MIMGVEKIGELCGIDILIDDSLPDDVCILHNAKEAHRFKDGKVEKVDLQEDWARYSRINRPREQQ